MRSALTLALVALGCARGRMPIVEALGPEQVPVWLPPAKEFCADVHLLTLEEVARGDGAGEVIAVEGVPEVAQRCVPATCPAERPCCEDCRGEYVLSSDAGVVVTLEGAGACSGSRCSFTCAPFGRRPVQAFRFVGLNSLDAESRPVRSIFVVEKVCGAQEGVAAPRRQ
ncbi:MAG: hypothetical protein JNJ54_19010 [Myxococcaceae bacterium]|nr:hypothetical protein [Myxococcaceae bacterium]